MSDFQLGAVEARFADLIWERESVSSAVLVKLCEEAFSWKKSTTYTVLKRLCDKGIFKNEKGTVIPLLTREEFYARQSERFVDEAFCGSLPAFLTAFTSRKAMKPEEIAQLRALIDQYEEG